MRSSVATGRVTASAVDVICQPRVANSKPAVVFAHNGASDATEAVGVGFPAMAPIISAIADAGFTIVSITQPVASFGNGAAIPAAGTGQARLVDGITYARTLPGVTSAPVVLLGDSMGSTAVLRYASLHPTNVACIVTWDTVADLSTSRFQNLGSNAAGISTAYGVANDGTTARGGTPLPADTDPAFANMVAAARVIPWLGHHSSDDFYWTTGIGNAGAGTPCGDAYAAAYGANATVVNVGANGHGNNSIAATSIPQVHDFVLAHT